MSLGDYASQKRNREQFLNAPPSQLFKRQKKTHFETPGDLRKLVSGKKKNKQSQYLSNVNNSLSPQGREPRGHFLQAIPASLFRGGANVNFAKPPVLQSDPMFETQDNQGLTNLRLTVENPQIRRVTARALQRVNYAPQIEHWIRNRSNLDPDRQAILEGPAPWKTSDNVTGSDQVFDDGGTYSQRNSLPLYAKASSSRGANASLFGKRTMVGLNPHNTGYMLNNNERIVSSSHGVFSAMMTKMLQEINDPDRQRQTKLEILKSIGSNVEFKDLMQYGAILYQTGALNKASEAYSTLKTAIAGSAFTQKAYKHATMTLGAARVAGFDTYVAYNLDQAFKAIQTGAAIAGNAAAPIVRPVAGMAAGAASVATAAVSKAAAPVAAGASNRAQQISNFVKKLPSEGMRGYIGLTKDVKQRLASLGTLALGGTLTLLQMRGNQLMQAYPGAMMFAEASSDAELFSSAHRDVLSYILQQQDQNTGLFKDIANRSLTQQELDSLTDAVPGSSYVLSKMYPSIYLNVGSGLQLSDADFKEADEAYQTMWQGEKQSYPVVDFTRIMSKAAEQVDAIQRNPDQFFTDLFEQELLINMRETAMARQFYEEALAGTAVKTTNGIEEMLSLNELSTLRRHVERLEDAYEEISNRLRSEMAIQTAPTTSAPTNPPKDPKYNVTFDIPLLSQRPFAGPKGRADNPRQIMPPPTVPQTALVEPAVRTHNQFTDPNAPPTDSAVAAVVAAAEDYADQFRPSRSAIGDIIGLGAKAIRSGIGSAIEIAGAAMDYMSPPVPSDADLQGPHVAPPTPGLPPKTIRTELGDFESNADYQAWLRDPIGSTSPIAQRQKLGKILQSIQPMFAYAQSENSAFLTLMTIKKFVDQDVYKNHPWKITAQLFDAGIVGGITGSEGKSETDRTKAYQHENTVLNRRVNALPDEQFSALLTAVQPKVEGGHYPIPITEFSNMVYELLTPEQKLISQKVPTWSGARIRGANDPPIPTSRTP